LIREDGYREAMVGAISLYDAKGERQHSLCLNTEKPRLANDWSGKLGE
jgi:hypothetical protein